MADAGAGPSALPSGWTEHISPAGRAYYHHNTSGVSTYTRPTHSHQPKRKREKPTSKTPILGTDGWFKVTTNRHNVFFWHETSKKSEWMAPSHIAAHVQQLEDSLRQEAEQQRKVAQQQEREEREKLRRERREKKRKAEQGVPITEFGAAEAKRARPDEEDDGELSDLDDTDEDEVEAQDVEPVSDTESVAVEAGEQDDEEQDDEEQDDEEWQRQIAEQMAAEAAASAQESNTDASPTPPPAPEATLSTEEQKTAFVALLTSLNGTPHEINPMAPWDLELPKFSHHASFLALAAREREEAFNEWCKLRLREKRAARSTQPPVKGDGGSRAEAEFRALLRAEVRSTRTRFADFREAFVRDRRFAAFGRSDGERERVFKAYLVELGEEKRRAAEQAETAFTALLGEKLPGNLRNKVAEAKAASGAEREAVMAVWMQAKRTPGLVEDKRYDAVGSSTRRFELFAQWARGERRPQAPSQTKESRGKERDGRDGRDERDGKEEARVRAMREREEKVRRERQRIERTNRAALASTERSESRRQFSQLLVDAVHSPHVSWRSAAARLEADARFGALPEGDKESLFSEHVRRLAQTEREKLARVFERYAPALDTHRDDVLAQTMHDDALAHPPLSVYRHDPDKLDAAYEEWKRARQDKAKRAFDEMLRESAFVEFWGRMKKVSAETRRDQKQGAKKEEEEEEEEEEEVMLADMARTVDLDQIQAVLGRDARFRAFRHVPEQREAWIRQHLHSLAAPSKSVHR